MGWVSNIVEMIAWAFALSAIVNAFWFVTAPEWYEDGSE